MGVYVQFTSMCACVYVACGENGTEHLYPSATDSDQIQYVRILACTFLLHRSHSHSLPFSNRSSLKNRWSASSTDLTPVPTSRHKSWKWLYVLDVLPQVEVGQLS